jgi:hypothetical protein
MNKKSDKIVVYTSIYGYKDLLMKQPKYPNVDYICFTDCKDFKSKTWRIIIKNGFSSNPKLNAKMFKILPHMFLSSYKYSIWIDGNVTCRQNPGLLIDRYLKTHNIAMFKHGRIVNGKGCIYEEASACIEFGLDDPDIIARQISRYKEQGYPELNGLAVCRIIMRKHNEPEIIEAMKNWWYEILDYSKRDQISFNYIMHKHNLRYEEIERNTLEEYFHTEKHLWTLPSENFGKITAQLVHFFIKIVQRYPCLLFFLENYLSARRRYLRLKNYFSR